MGRSSGTRRRTASYDTAARAQALADAGSADDAACGARLNRSPAEHACAAEPPRRLTRLAVRAPTGDPLWAAGRPASADTLPAEPPRQRPACAADTTGPGVG